MRTSFLLLCVIFLAASQVMPAQVNVPPQVEPQAPRETSQSPALKKDSLTPHSSKSDTGVVAQTPKPNSPTVTPSNTIKKETSSGQETGKTSIGVGMGLDYGGLFGFNVTLYPVKNVGVFGGLGYALIGAGYNVGAKLRFVGKSSFHSCPFVEFMYGYNAVIKVTNAESLNKMFYGTTLGIGWDNVRNDKGFSIALLIPFRGSAVTDYQNMLQTKYGARITQELLPIAFSVGYKWYFK